jgi:hypothetical protein
MSGDSPPEEGRVEIADIIGEFHAVERIQSAPFKAKRLGKIFVV